MADPSTSPTSSRPPLLTSLRRTSVSTEPHRPPATSLSLGTSIRNSHNTFSVGVAEDVNRKCRRTMEDSHAFAYDYTGVEDTGYFAIFDGHAGPQAADWCGSYFSNVLAAIIEREEGSQKDKGNGKDLAKGQGNGNGNEKGMGVGMGSRIGSNTISFPEILDKTFTQVDAELKMLPNDQRNTGCTAIVAVVRWEQRAIKSSTGEEKRVRVLYTANVGDARIILCRTGKAIRLSYDHKGTDERETQRVTEAGGLVLNSRVNGVLAVTRALGDHYMKDLVTSRPYTTETLLHERHDEFLILACDGLWDVCSDQHAVDLVRDVMDPEEASQMLVKHALQEHSTDNLSCMVVRFDRPT